MFVGQLCYKGERQVSKETMVLRRWEANRFAPTKNLSSKRQLSNIFMVANSCYPVDNVIRCYKSRTLKVIGQFRKMVLAERLM